jgi:hypothetical protein
MRKRQLLEAEAVVLKLGVEWANTRNATPKDGPTLALLAAVTRYQWVLSKVDSDPPPIVLKPSIASASATSTFDDESPTQTRRKK